MSNSVMWQIVQKLPTTIAILRKCNPNAPGVLTSFLSKYSEEICKHIEYKVQKFGNKIPVASDTRQYQTNSSGSIDSERKITKNKKWEKEIDNTPKLEDTLAKLVETRSLSGEIQKERENIRNKEGYISQIHIEEFRPKLFTKEYIQRISKSMPIHQKTVLSEQNFNLLEYLETQKSKYSIGIGEIQIKNKRGKREDINILPRDIYMSEEIVEKVEEINIKNKGVNLNENEYEDIINLEIGQSLTEKYNLPIKRKKKMRKEKGKFMEKEGEIGNRENIVMTSLEENINKNLRKVEGEKEQGEFQEKILEGIEKTMIKETTDSLSMKKLLKKNKKRNRKKKKKLL